MKWLQEITEWNAPYEVQNHLYYVNDSRSHAVGYIPAGSKTFKKFTQPMQIDMRRRKFITVNKKVERDEVYFQKPKEEKPAGLIEVLGSSGKKYFLAPGPNGWTCTCPGFQFRRVCKHTATQGVLPVNTGVHKDMLAAQ